MAKKGKGNRVQVILECATCRSADTKGVSRYVTVKNRRNNSERIELKKYCPFERTHTLHREIR